MRAFLAIAGFLIFVFATGLALYLLALGKFSGAEFTAFVVAFAVIGMVVGYAPEVQEISIVGNVVKLKEIKAEALKAIESLNKSRIEMLRVFLGLALKHGGGFGSETPVDPRARDIWPLFRLSKEYSCQKELKDELLLCVKILLASQLYSIKTRNRDARIVVSEVFLPPFELASIAFDETGIEEALAVRSPKPDNFKDEIRLALEEYSRLYEFKIELEAIK
ncbi:DUF1512 domain-containing protein [Pseudomonas sp. IT-P74]|uniref:hypothetical protein n=1 Tax=Pseudomonas sp. IT-P74 TaxID=3026445 RepID=UPI0039DFC7C6